MADVLQLDPDPAPQPEPVLQLDEEAAPVLQLDDEPGLLDQFGTAFRRGTADMASFVARHADPLIGGENVISKAVKDAAGYYAEKTREYYPEIESSGLSGTAAQFVGSAAPIMLSGPAAPGVGAMTSAEQEFQRATARGATPEQAAASEAISGITGAVTGLIPMKIAAGPTAAVKDVVANAAINAGQQLSSNVGARLIYNKDQRLGEGVPQAAAAGAAIPGIMHTVKAVKAPPRPLVAQDVATRLKGRYGENAVSVAGADAVQVQIPDGRKMLFRLTEDVGRSADPATFAKNLLDSVKAEDPAAHKAAMDAAQGDPIKAAAALWDSDWRLAGSANGRGVMVTGPDGSGVRYDMIVDLAKGEATRGTLDHEEFHALMKLADVPPELIAQAGGEEALAVKLGRRGDHPVRAWLRRLAERVSPVGEQFRLSHAEQMVAGARGKVMASEAGVKPQPTMEGAREQAVIAGMEQPPPLPQTEVPMDGTSPTPEFQGLEKARRELVLPPDLKGKLAFKRSDRKLGLKFEDPADEAIYRMGELTKKPGTGGMAQADRVRRILAAKLGLSSGQMARHLEQVRAAVRDAAEAAGKDDMVSEATIARQAIGADTREAVTFMDRGAAVADEAGTVWRVMDRRANAKNEVTYTLRDAAGNERRVDSDAGFFKPTAEQEAAAPAMPETISESVPAGAQGKVAESGAAQIRSDLPAPDPVQPDMLPLPEAGTPEAMRAELQLVESEIALAHQQFNFESASVFKNGDRKPNPSKYESDDRWQALADHLEPKFKRATELREALGIPDEVSPAAAAELEAIIDPPEGLPFAVYRRKKAPRGMEAPNLSLIVTGEKQRAMVAALDQKLAADGYWQQQMDMQATREQAQADLAANPADVDRIKRLRIDTTSVDDHFKAAKVLDDTALVDFDVADPLHTTMREHGSELGRAMAARRDLVDGPEKRIALLKRALLTFNADLEARKRSSDPEVARKAKAEARKQWEAVIEQWKQEGTLIERPIAEPVLPVPDAVPAPGSGMPPAAPAGADTATVPVAEPNPLAPKTEWVINPAVAADPQRAASVLRDLTARRSSATNVWNEIYRNSLLASTKGWMANALSGGNVIRDVTLNWWAEATLNDLRKAFGKSYEPNSATWGDIQRAYRDILPIALQASRNLLAAWKTETSRFDDPFWEGNNFAIQGKTGRAVRIPQRINMAMDEFWMTIATEMNQRAMARRLAEAEGHVGPDLDVRILDLMTNPPEVLRQKAIEQAQLLTFKSDPGALANWFMKLGRGDIHPANDTQAKLAEGGALLVNMIFPFKKTPVNVIRQGLRMSPLGSLRLMTKFATDAQYRGNFGGQLTRDVAEQMVAYAAAGLVWQMMQPDEQGRPAITGSSAGWQDAGRRDFQNQLIPPNSIRIGDKWYSYSRLDPLATSLQLTVDAMDAIRNSGNLSTGSALTRTAQTMTGMVRDKTFLQQLDNIMQVMDDPTDAGKIIEAIAAGHVPTVVKDVIKSQTDAVPGRFKGQGGPEGGVDMADRIAAKALPIPAFAPPQKLDRTGVPMWKASVFANPLWETLYRIAVPIEVRNAPNLTNEERLLWNYYRARPNERMPGMPEDTFTLDGQQYRMTADEYGTFVRMRHQVAMQLASQRGENFNIEAPTPDDMIRYRALLTDAGRMSRQAIIAARNTATRNAPLILD